MREFFSLNSVRNRLVLLFFAITAAAVGFIYLYVVPQLRDSLTAEKLDRLGQGASAEAGRLGHAMESGYSQGRLQRLIQSVSQKTDARVTVLGVRQTATGPQPEFVIADS